jgi:hypothetical protein
MGVARRAMVTMAAIRVIPTTILTFTLFHLHFLFTRSLWFWCGLDVRCNEVFQFLKQLIRSGLSLFFVGETCVPELWFLF